MVAFSASYRVAAACASPTVTSPPTSNPPASTAPARTSLRWVLRTRVSLGVGLGSHGNGEARAAWRTVRQIALSLRDANDVAEVRSTDRTGRGAPGGARRRRETGRRAGRGLSTCTLAIHSAAVAAWCPLWSAAILR